MSAKPDTRGVEYVRAVLIWFAAVTFVALVMRLWPDVWSIALVVSSLTLLVLVTSIIADGMNTEDHPMPTTPRTDADRSEIAFADALALQAVEAFVERVMARYARLEYKFVSQAILDELEAWRAAVPAAARQPDATTDA